MMREPDLGEDRQGIRTSVLLQLKEHTERVHMRQLSRAWNRVQARYLSPR